MSQRMWINEFHYDNTGTDENEFIEIVVEEGADLSLIQMVRYDGNGTAENPILSVDPGFMAGSTASCFTIYHIDQVLENDVEGIALLYDGVVVQFISYEDGFMALDGPAAGYLSEDIGLEESNSTSVGYSLYLTGNGMDYTDFTWQSGTNSKGLINESQNFSLPNLSASLEAFTNEAPPVSTGDTIKYTLTITNDQSGGAAKNLDISQMEPTDPNTILIPGSFKSTPLAYDRHIINVVEDQNKMITLIGLDLDGDALTYSITDPPNNGALGAIMPAGPTTGYASILYTPSMNFFGRDTFEFTVEDDDGGICPGTIHIEVQPINDPPGLICGMDEIITSNAGLQTINNWATAISVGPANENFQTATITVTNDNNDLFATQPDVSPSGTLTYTPQTDSVGSASVTVSISDGIMADDYECTFNITINAGPSAMDDAFNTTVSTNLSGSLFSDNGMGEDYLGFPLATIVNFGGGNVPMATNAPGSMVAFGGGTLQVNSDGSFSLTGQPFTADTYTFNYTIQNSEGMSNAEVTVVIMSDDMPAICNGDTYTGTGNIAIEVNATFGVLSNDAGTNLVVEAVQGNSMNVGMATAATNGTVTLNSDGGFIFEPTAGATSGSFTYTVDNPLNMPQSCTVTINFSSMIWFIDISGTGTNSGTYLNPFQSIAAFNVSTGPQINHYISLAGGTYTEANGFTMKNGQVLIGEGVRLDQHFTANANSITAYKTFAAIPTNSANRPSVVVSAMGTHTILLAQNNTIRGLNIDNANFGIRGAAAAGNATISEASIRNSGFAIELNGGNLNISFDELSGTKSDMTSPIIFLKSDPTGSFSCSSGKIVNAGPAIDIDGNNLSLNMSLDSVNANGQNSGEGLRGIRIKDVTGSFTITGTGSMSESGGVIQNFKDDGVLFENASNISLSYLKIDKNGNAMGENGLELREATGIVDLNNITVSESYHKNIEITNSTGSMTFTMDGSVVEKTKQLLGANIGAEINVNGNATATIDIDACTIREHIIEGLVINGTSTAIISKCDITNCTFNPGINNGEGIKLSTSDMAQLTYNVIGNVPLYSRNGNAIRSTSTGTSTANGRINNNVIQVLAVGGPASPGRGIFVASNDQSTVAVEINGNTISNLPEDVAILVRTSGTGTSTLHSTINGNTISGLGMFALAGLNIDAQNSRKICSNITNNIVTLSGSPAYEFFANENASGSIELQGFMTDAATTWSMNGNATSSNILEVGMVSGGTCNSVTHPNP